MVAQADRLRMLRGTTRRAIVLTATVVALLAAGADRLAADAFDCRRTVGREGTRFLIKTAASLRKCEERRLSSPAETCPGPREIERAVRWRDRARLAIAAACPGPPPPEFPADCPDPCAAPVADGSALATCILCLAEAGSADFIAHAYPQATPAAETATPAATATATATTTPSAAALCGDGQVGAGEQCDPPADGACPGRCIAPGAPGACQCAPPQSCIEVAQPPGSCTADGDCPPAYTCDNGECRAGVCQVRADCPAGGQCVYRGSVTEGACVCRGCGPWDCTLGCQLGLVVSGCRCTRVDDCPPEDDVCFLGVCS